MLVEFYDMGEDEIGVAEYDDTRRPRLTWLQLQKMRKAKDAQQIDRAEHLDFLPTMYATPSEDDGGGEF